MFNSKSVRKTKFGRFTLATAVASLGLWSLGGNAATTTSSLQSSATVPVSCTIDSVTNISVASYDPINTNKSSDLTTTGGVDVTCTNGSTATIGLGEGANHDTSTRRLSDGGGTPTYLNYELYTDSGRSTIWDENTNTVTHNGDGTSQSHTVYVKIPAGQNSAVAATYTDTVNVTVTF